MSKKTNDPLATRRLNSLPKSEKVRDAKEVKGAAVKAAERQNLMDGKKGKGNLAQVPAGREYPTTTESSN